MDRLEVSDEEIRIRGSFGTLARGLVNRPEAGTTGVPSFGREWWAQQNSNLRPHCYERAEKARTTAEILEVLLLNAESGCK